MRTEEQWTLWQDEHPWLAGLAMAGIYALIWLGVLLSFALIALIFAWVASW